MSLSLLVVVSGIVVAFIAIWVWRTRKKSATPISLPSSESVEVSEKKADPIATRPKSGRFARALSNWWSALNDSTKDPAKWERLLIESDLGPHLAKKLVQEMTTTSDSPEVFFKKSLGDLLKGADSSSGLLKNLLSSDEPNPTQTNEKRQSIVLVVGINGAGKTTTLVKLGHYFRRQSISLGIVGADTFRKAAQEQLQRGCEKAQLDFFTIAGPESSEGADPSSVIFDGIKKFSDRQLVIIDTSGRLHTKVNLMEELKKMKRVAQKAAPSALIESWLVVDATLGQNSLAQAKIFHEAMDLNGFMVTKMDGLSRGGTIFRLYQELHLPILFLGLGEGLEDLEIFNSESFVQELFDPAARSS